jgi:hypothetical protein
MSTLTKEQITRYMHSLIDRTATTSHPSELLFCIAERTRAEGQAAKGRRIVSEWKKYVAEEGGEGWSEATA